MDVDLHNDKRSLGAQLRYHGIQQGDFSVSEMDDDQVLDRYTRYWCGAYHVTGPALIDLMERSLDERQFRFQWPV
jgi:hypothetical protein